MDHREIERRSRAMVEAQRPVRYWLPRDVRPDDDDDADLDELERRAAVLEAQVAALEDRASLVRAALGLSPGRRPAQGPTNSAMSSSTTSPHEASTSRNRRITVA